jgi:hypothetical protein
MFFLALSTQIHAANPENSQDSLRQLLSTMSGKDGDPSSKGLEQRMSPEELERFNRDMETQTEEAYPDHADIESRRQKMRERMQEWMQQADVDHDNSISRAEAEESMPGVARHFDQIDTNHDGVITLDEIKAAQEKAAQEKKRESLEQQISQNKDNKAQPPKAKKRSRKKPASHAKPKKNQPLSDTPPSDNSSSPDNIPPA